MPRTVEDVENYLLQLDRRYEIDGGTYLISAESHDQPPIALRVAPPIVAIRVAITQVPAEQDHQTITVTPEINSIAGPKIDAAFLDSGSNAFGIP